MCGIVGTVNSPFDKEILNLIAHRGPDDSDIVTLTNEQDTVSLGHVRLSIQDLSPAGHQPMYSACQRFLIIFNGEIYNHFALREKLCDIPFNGHSDTETIVNYIARFGINAIRDFNGIFGLACYDLEHQKLYIARDRYGVKPIYFYQNNNAFICSSEIRPIQALIDTQVDNDNLATLLKLRYNPAPTTLYRTINKLRAGEILEYTIPTHQAHTYSFITPVPIDSTLTFEKALEKYGELFEQAIKRQLLSDVEVGVLLSGGIDSALVAYFAQKHSSKPIKTFTIGFNEEDDSDETRDAQETAQILGTKHYAIKIDEGQFETIFKTCIDIVEEPLGTTSIIPMYYLNQLVAAHGIKVVLTGQGADEPLGGYGRYRGEMMHRKVPSFLFKLGKPFNPFIKNESLHRAINALGEKELIKRWQLIYTVFSDPEIKRLIDTNEKQSSTLINYFYTLLQGDQKDSVNAMMSNDMRMNLCDDLLLYTDKISMHFSIEARVPMLDNELVDFIESLPLNYKIEKKEAKYIHKKFAERVLPKEIIYRKKKGFRSPTQQWFKGEKGLHYRKLLTNNTTPFSRFFNTDEIHTLFTTHIENRRNMEKELFILISLYHWMEKNAKSNY